MPKVLSIDLYTNLCYSLLVLKEIINPTELYDMFMEQADMTRHLGSTDYSHWEPLGDTDLEKNQIHPLAVVFDTGRTLDEVASVHGLRDHEVSSYFLGKKVLDVGCGYSELGEDFDGDTTVVGIDLPHTFAKETEYFAERRDSTLYVAGNGQSLPFKSESFDTLVSTFSLLEHLYSGDQGVQFIKESLRVLKNNGTALFAPVHPNFGYIDGRNGTKRVLEELASIALDPAYSMSYSPMRNLRIHKH